MEKDIQIELMSVNSMLWFRLFLNNLAFNAAENIHLTDPDVNEQAKAWAEMAKTLIPLAEEDIREKFQKTIQLAPRVQTGMFGFVREEDWHDFCQSNQQMLDTIKEIFEHYNIRLSL